MLGVCALTVLAFGQDFGRFGYRESWQLPGLEVDAKGIRTSHELADTLRFPKPLPMWRPVATRADGQTIFTNGGASLPTRLRADATMLGCALHYEGALRLEFGTTQAPYLTWAEGSVSDGVPTAASTWIALSFRDQQPALLFLSDEPIALHLKGAPGKWALESTSPLNRWIRVVPLSGNQPFRTNSAAELGALARQAKALAPLLKVQAPRVVDLMIEDDPQGVRATWTFDQPQPMIPNAFLLAPLGGYPVRVTGDPVRTDVVTELGPTYFAEGTQLRLRLPIRRVPSGRAVTTGRPADVGLASASFLDVGNVAALGLASMLGTRDALTMQAAQDTLDAFLEQGVYETEPFTRQKLPFAADGAGIDVAAAHALLMQCLLSAQRPDSSPNALLTSLAWRRDAFHWRVAAEDPVVARRAAALAALAGALCAEPERRLDAALFQAGLASEAGLRIWQRRRGMPTETSTLIEPLAGIRRRLFGITVPGPDPWYEALMSPVRVYGAPGFWVEHSEGQHWLVGSTDDAKTVQVSLSASTELSLEAGENVKEAKSNAAFGTTVAWITPLAAGPWRARIVRPAFAPGLPATPPLLTYSE